MTPTEQDNELHSKSYKLAQEYLSTDNLEWFVDLIQNNLTLDEALQLITADRELVALEKEEMAFRYAIQVLQDTSKEFALENLQRQLDKNLAQQEEV